MRSRVLKWIGGAAVAVLVGAVGSGLWERAMEPALEAIGSALVSGIGSVFSTYRDSIYSEAAQGFHEQHSLTLLGVLLFGMSGIFAGFWFAIYFGEKDGFREASPSFVRVLRRHQFIGVFALAMLVMTSILTLRAHTVNQVTAWSLNSIEILAPFVGPESRLVLRSKFFSVKSLAEYRKFHEELLTLAEKNHITLPEANAP